MGDEGVAGEIVLLPALEHGFDPVGTVELQVAGAHLGRGAVHHDVNVLEQVVQASDDGKAGIRHHR